MNLMVLKTLDSEEIALIVHTISTPVALYNILHSRKDITAVRQCLLDSTDARQAIEEFVRERLFDLKPKIYFLHEPAFCGLAVALESLPLPAAEEFLAELAALKIAEMPISPHVAALCLERRRKILTSDTLTVFKVAAPLPLPEAPSQVKYRNITNQESYILRAA
jgi:hypothetical protein